MNSAITALQRQFATDLTTFSLKTVIILWCLVIIGLALLINNKWVLAGILAYEVLP